MNFSCPIVFSVGSETSSKLFCKGARAVRTRKFNCHLDSVGGGIAERRVVVE